MKALEPFSEKRSRKKVLVTGGAGFIGSHVAEKLLDRGDEVICLDNFNHYYSRQLKEDRVEKMFMEKGHPNCAQGDVSSFEFMKGFFEHIGHFDKVVHFAAQAGVRHSIDHPEDYTSSNLVGMANILELCKEFGSDLVFASSSSVYGDTNEVPFREDANTDNPESYYAATKKSNEVMASSYSSLFGMNITGVRPFTVFGPWGRPDMAYFKFAKKIMDGEEITLFNPSNNRRDYTFVDDMADGVVSAVDNAPEGFNIYNLGRGNPRHLYDLVCGLEDGLGKRRGRVDVIEKQKGDVDVTYADISKAQRELGYDPKVSFEEGIQRFCEWYKDKDGGKYV
jgi:UDP-glucuronate 4-epimerase